MKLKSFVVAVLVGAIGLPLTAHAGTIFSCTLQNGKKVSVTGDDVGGLTYRYGKNLSRPELSFSVPVFDSYHSFSNHVGGADISALGLPRGNYLYVVGHGYSEDGEEFGYLSAYQNNRQIADHTCKGNITEDLHTVFGAAQDGSHLPLF